VLHEPRFTAWEWLALVASLLGATALTTVIGLNQKSSDAVIYTVVVFAVVITALRPAWRRRAFWRNLALVFVLHAVGMSILLHILSEQGHGISGLLMIVCGMVEGIVIGSVLWKKAHLSGLK
jgi:heme/copper-type cytochrome/quinol oxidase subunit 4